VSTIALLGYAISVLLNVYLLAARARDRRRNAHVHTWTPWSEWRTMRQVGDVYQAFFRRVRYCTECAREESQEVGNHDCRARDKYNTLSCPHRDVFTEIFDPLYELRQINKDLEELQ
jgi:hypothetical protein